MIFLIQYDRRRGKIVSLTPYGNEQQEAAEDDRLQLELKLDRGGPDHEVVLLEAESEEALRKTHRRYFESAQEILESARKNGHQSL